MHRGISDVCRATFLAHFLTIKNISDLQPTPTDSILTYLTTLPSRYGTWLASNLDFLCAASRPRCRDPRRVPHPRRTGIFF